MGLVIRGIGAKLRIVCAVIEGHEEMVIDTLVDLRSDQELTHRLESHDLRHSLCHGRCPGNRQGQGHHP